MLRDHIELLQKHITEFVGELSVSDECIDYGALRRIKDNVDCEINCITDHIDWEDVEEEVQKEANIRQPLVAEINRLNDQLIAVNNRATDLENWCDESSKRIQMLLDELSRVTGKSTYIIGGRIGYSDITDC